MKITFPFLLITLLFIQCKKPQTKQELVQTINESLDELNSYKQINGDTLPDNNLIIFPDSFQFNNFITEKSFRKNKINFLQALNDGAPFPTYKQGQIDTAEILIKEYLKTIPENERAGAVKSVYFHAEDIITLLSSIPDTSSQKGIRIYFAKYPSNYLNSQNEPHPYKGLNTLVLRAVDGIKDLPATVPNSLYNFGDLCPKNCSPEKYKKRTLKQIKDGYSANKTETGGDYKTIN